MTLAAILVALHYLLLGPLAWAYLYNWISTEQWVAISDLFAGATEYLLHGSGPVHEIYVQWILFWEV